MATKRLKNLQSLYLDLDRAALLDELKEETRLPKEILVREAVDDLLVKYGKLKPVEPVARKRAK